MHIGLFDSGVGGLTVLKEIMNSFPDASITYLGDTARLPYGNKAPETIQKYVNENVEFLKSKGVDLIIIACHSASSVSLKLTSSDGVPIHNVIAPSCAQALAQSSNKRIGILATKATTLSEVYPKYIKDLDKEAQVLGESGPLLVPLVEEGLIEDAITDQVLTRYLKPLLDFKIDTLLLGCTHYPILKGPIQRLCGDIQLVDPAETLSAELKASLGDSPTASQELDIYLTDHAPHFLEHAKKLLGDTLASKMTWHSL